MAQSSILRSSLALPVRQTGAWEATVPLSSSKAGGTTYLLLVQPPELCDQAGIMVTGIIGPLSARANAASYTLPVQIDWSLYGIYGSRVDDDDTPVFQGSTFLTSASERREGLLVQVAGRLATSWHLRARLVDTPAAPPYGEFTIELNLGARLFPSGLALGGLDVQVGPLIG
jgi:hypothetical protein